MAAAAKKREIFNKFDFHLLTSEYSKEFCVKWTLSAISQFPSDAKFESPNLDPAFECRLFVKKQRYRDLIIGLENDSDREIGVETSVSIFDSDEELRDSSDGSYKCDSRSHVNIFNAEGAYQRLLKLKDDTVMLVCKLKITRMMTTKYQGPKLTVEKYNGRKKFCEDLKTLFHDRKYADVSLKVDGDQIPANKAILSARSAVFDRMFRHNMNEQESGCVQVDDVKLPVLKKLVEFLYMGELDVNGNDVATVSGLYYAADKYEVLDLRKMCADTLISLITVDNAAEIVVIAHRHGDEYLKDQALVFVGKNINHIIMSGKWNEFVNTDAKLSTEVLEYCIKTNGIKS